MDELLKAWHCENVFPILIVSLTAKGAREIYLGIKECCGCLDIEELYLE